MNLDELEQSLHDDLEEQGLSKEESLVLITELRQARTRLSSYDQLKSERDRYIEHIKSLINQRNLAFNHEDDVKVVLREVQKDLETLEKLGENTDEDVVQTFSAWEATFTGLKERVAKALGSWSKT